MTELRKADVLEDIKTYKDYFFDIIYSDPPYNLSSEWFIDTDGQYKIKRKAKDFLNKWEGLTEVEFDTFFKESYRTLKHGGYLIMYGIDRQLGPFHYYAVKNGFEVCQSLYWFFMSNFPKASDVFKQYEKKIDSLCANLKNVKNVEQLLKKNQIEVGINIIKKFIVQENVVSQPDVMMKQNIPLIVEIVDVKLNDTKPNHLDLKMNIVVNNVELNMVQQHLIASFVEKQLQDQSQIVNQQSYFVQKNVTINLCELLQSKVEDPTKIENGKNLSLNLETINVQFVEAIKNLKHIILKELLNIQNYDTNQQMEYVSAISVTTTEYIMDNLITNTVDILVFMLKEKLKKYEGYKYSIAPLKQVLETVMVFHKPLKGKSYIDDIIACETETDIHSSCLNIEGERVEYNGTHPAEIYGDSYMKSGHSKNKITDELQSISGNDRNGVYVNETGRFPSQLLVDENAAAIIDEQTGSKMARNQVYSSKPFYKIGNQGFEGMGINNKVFEKSFNYDDSGGGSKILHICKPDSDIHPSCLNIEGERVEYKDEKALEHLDKYKNGYGGNGSSTFGTEKETKIYGSTDGRFPSQLLVDENAAKVIDEQTGIRKATTFVGATYKEKGGELFNLNGQKNAPNNPGDTGGGSKILHTCKYEEDEMDLLKYQPKVSKSERNAGLEKIEGKNQNPCLKPISLNKHILNLFKTPNRTRIYIPFAGSGSEVIAAESVGYDEIYAAEINEDYCKIAEVRIIYWREKEAQDQSKIKSDTKPLKKKKEAPEVKSSEEDDFWG